MRSRKNLVIIIVLNVIIWLLYNYSLSFAQQPDLLISEYVDGTGQNKALEIYNAGLTTIDLVEGNYQIQFFFDGSAVADRTINLGPGQVHPKQVYVLAHTLADSSIIADQTAGGAWFDGNDAVALLKDGEWIDIIGKIGEDPGVEWGSDPTSTKENTLRRKGPIVLGNTGNGSFDPAIEWLGFPVNTFDGLGTHDTTPPELVSTMPISGAIDIPVNTLVIATFTEPVTVIDFTVTYNNFTFEVFGDHTEDGNSIIFTPDNPLLYNKKFNANLFGIIDLAGNPFEGDIVFGSRDNYTWIFTSETEPVPLPEVYFEQDQVFVPEDAGVVELTVVLSESSSDEVSVDYETIPGSAGDGDFGVLSDTLIFPPGTTTQTFDIPIIDDDLDEIDETFSVTLSNAQNAVITSPSTVTVTIIDDDTLPTVDFSQAAYTVGEEDGEAPITVTLSFAYPQTATVEYETGVGGTAIPGVDYEVVSGTLTFTPGITEQQFSVPILNDSIMEPDKTVELNLSGASNAVVGSVNNPAELTIIDDDTLPTVDFSQAAYTVGEEDGEAPITVTLSFAYPQTATVEYETGVGGTAIPGVDYEVVSGTLTFTPGITEQQFSAPILNDSIMEPDKTVELNLSSASNAVVGSVNNPAELTIIDDDIKPVVTVLINELDADQTGTTLLKAPFADQVISNIPEPEDEAEFIELFDGGTGNTTLDGLALVFYNGDTDKSYKAIDLSGYSTGPEGYFVIGNAGVANVDIIFENNFLKDGEHAVALYEDDWSNFPNGTPVTTTNLIDAIVYKTDVGTGSGLLVLLNPGQPIVDENGAGNQIAHSSQRCPNGGGGARNTDTYAQYLPTPGTVNTCDKLLLQITAALQNVYLPIVLN